MVKISRSQSIGRCGIDSGRFRDALCRRAIRPSETFIARRPTSALDPKAGLTHVLATIAPAPPGSVPGPHSVNCHDLGRQPVGQVTMPL